ncbi:MAG: family metallo-hydrolase [Conexibacter sp.]|nr:family metallo-hydrolase [Conexibacter sp.]
MEAVVEHCRALLRLDTTNPGSTEEAAAAYVTDVLSAAGLPWEVVEPEPGRVSVISRHPGADRELPALVVHCHLDVVPAQDEGWSHDPFGGVVQDGFLWGRGAIDMKDFAAMMLTTQVALAGGPPPRRDIVFAYFADEEMGGGLGARWIAEHRPDLFEGAAWGVGEIGGFTVVLPNGRRVYPIQVAEKGLLWFRITMPGVGAHAALTEAPNATAALGRVLSRIADLTTADPVPAASALLAEHLTEIVGDGADAASVLDGLGTFGRMAGRARATTFVPTIASSGAKVNVIPDRADLYVDCRFVPGGAQHARQAIDGVLEEGMTCEVVASMPGSSSPPEGELFTALGEAIHRLDPEGTAVPFMLPAGSDAQHLGTLGISSYGFTPLVLPAGFDYLGLFHAVDERVPIDGLIQGHRAFDRLVRTF